MGVGTDWLTPPVPAEHRVPWQLVSVGSLVPKKGHDVLLEAIARADPRWTLVIVGDGPQRLLLARAIDELGLADRVVLAGARPESFVRDLVRTSEGFVLASVIAADGDRDGIPVALMEAMASATPVVASTVGAVEELVDRAGILVRRSDPSAFASAIDRLRDRDVRATLGACGRERVTCEFSSEASGAAVLATAQAYRKLAA
jgi:glycosyltransferase involved in cell wall biosynthesis